MFAKLVIHKQNIPTVYNDKNGKIIVRLFTRYIVTPLFTYCASLVIDNNLFPTPALTSPCCSIATSVNALFHDRTYRHGSNFKHDTLFVQEEFECTSHSIFLQCKTIRENIQFWNHVQHVFADDVIGPISTGRFSVVLVEGGDNL